MSLSVRLAGEAVSLLPERALFRPENRTLYVADTHWGKVATLRAHRIPLPEGALADDLRRLSRALAGTGAERLVVLGDLIHSAHSLQAAAVVAAVSAWRVRHAGLCVRLVRGNHDRALARLPSAWGVEVVEPGVGDAGWVLAHEPPEHPRAFTLCGHLHPTWTLRGEGRQVLNLPCFMRLPDVLILPAFARMTGASTYTLPGLQQVYVTTPQRVLPVLGE